MFAGITDQSLILIYIIKILSGKAGPERKEEWEKITLSFVDICIWETALYNIYTVLKMNRTYILKNSCDLT